MKKIKLLFFALALTATSIAGLEAQVKSTMNFEIDKWDFGTIQELSGLVEHTFKFTNKGDNPFVIENVSVSCGCTTPEFSRAPVLPGRSSEIRIAFDPAGRPGAFSKDIVVYSNGGKNVNTITITGNVTPRPRTVEDDYPIPVGGGLMVNTTSLMFGYVPRGAATSQTINIYNSGASPLRLETVMPASSHYKVAFSQNPLPAKGKGVITVTYDLRNADLWGRLEDEFEIKVNGKPGTLPFSSTAVAADDFTKLTTRQLEQAPKAVLQSQYHNFGNVGAGNPLSRKFTLSNNGSEPLVVRHIINGKGISTDLKAGAVVAPGKEVSFNVTLSTAGLPIGKVTGELTLLFNDPDRPLRELRLAATIID